MWQAYRVQDSDTGTLWFSVLINKSTLVHVRKRLLLVKYSGKEIKYIVSEYFYRCILHQNVCTLPSVICHRYITVAVVYSQ